MTALDEFKAQAWAAGQWWIDDGYGEVSDLLNELGITEPQENVQDDGDVEAFKARVWRVTEAAAERHGWCSDWEEALIDLGVPDPEEELRAAKHRAWVALNRVNAMLNRR